MGFRMAYELANHRKEHDILKRSISEKTGNKVFSKSHKIFCRETLSEFSDNSQKNLRLVRKLKIFLQIHEKSTSLKVFAKISVNFGKTFVTVKAYDKHFNNRDTSYRTKIHSLNLQALTSPYKTMGL